MVKYKIISPANLNRSITDLINSKIQKGYAVSCLNSEDFCRSGLLNYDSFLACSGTNFDCYNSPNQIGVQGWLIGENDTYIPVDLDGDRYDEILVLSENRDWIGILKYDHAIKKFVAKWIGHDWVNPHAYSGNYGWNLCPGDKFIPLSVFGDVDGKQILVNNRAGNWLGILSEANGRLICLWIIKDWVNFRGEPDNSGWRLGANDRYFAADIDGDRFDEIIVVSADGHWIGILKYNVYAYRIYTTWIGREWINTLKNTGSQGWKLNVGDQFITVDLDGDGCDEILVINANRDWIGILRYEPSTQKLVADCIAQNWVNPLGHPGECGWCLNRGDKFIPINIDSRFPNKKEILVSNAKSKSIGILRADAGKLVSYAICQNWINQKDQTGNVGWCIGSNDFHFRADLDGDLIDEALILSNDRQWLGILKYDSDSDKLVANNIIHNYIPPSTIGWGTRWRLNFSDKFYTGRYLDLNKDSIFIISKQSTCDRIRQNILSDLPNYLLLVGDCDSVPGYTLTIPCQDGQTNICFYSSDFYYAMDDDDLSPKIPIGRLSSSNPTILSQIVSNLLSYPNDNSKEWKNSVIFCGFLPDETDYDPDDPGWRCKDLNDNKLKFILEYENKINANDSQKELWGATDSTKTSLINSINNGESIIFYFGHGLSNLWDNIGVEERNENFSNRDVQSLQIGRWWEGTTIKENYKLPFVVSATCLTGRIQSNESFCETWQIHNKCIAIFGADTVSSTFFNARIIPLILEEIIRNGRRKLGDIIIHAIKEYSYRFRLDSEFNKDTIKMYRFFGDPDTLLEIVFNS